MEDLDLGATIKGFSSGQKIFGRYTLKKILGRGGMGVVWLARDEKLDREVALKFLPEVVKSDRAAMDDLKRETRRALELTHTHIVRIYDFVEDATTAAIAMEYVAGDTLSNRRLDQPARVFEPGELRRWVKQLCEALAYAHEKARIVHRDLKPANLMLDSHGDLKVADFGISRSISDSVSRVSAQAGSSGTPAYMSPQQMMGEKPEVADDIYALGATLYELLTGKPPFFSGNLIAQVQSKIPLSIAERRGELEVAGAPVPPEWEAAIAACLAKEPAQRPPSAREVAQRLGLAVSMDTTAPFAPAPARPPLKSAVPSAAPAPAARKARPAWLYPVIAAAILAIGAGYYFGVYAPEQKRIADEQARVAEENQQAEKRKTDLAEQAGRAAAEQKRQVIEAEDKAYQEISRTVLGLAEATSRADFEAVQKKVEAYLATAPDRYRAPLAAEWGQKAKAWLAYEAAHRPGSLVVESDPSGATVILYPANIRKTSPAVFKDLKPGEASFRVEKEGYEAQDLPVELKPGAETRAGLVRLISLTGSAVITSIPAGAKVSLDGNSRHFEGVTPFRQELIPPGTYRATFQRANWRPVEKTLVVMRNELVNLTAELRGVNLDIRSDPAGAQVKLNGREVGVTPLSLADQAPGEYQMTLTREGYDPLSKSFTAEGAVTVSETLVRTPPKITRLVFFRKKVIYVGAATFTLKIDGAAVGKLANGSYWVKQLSPGVHSVGASSLGIEMGARQVQLQEGTTTYLEWSPTTWSAEWRAASESEALGMIGILKLDKTSPDKLDLPGDTKAPPKRM